jgi:hypothetical protein
MAVDVSCHKRRHQVNVIYNRECQPNWEDFHPSGCATLTLPWALLSRCTFPLPRAQEFLLNSKYPSKHCKIHFPSNHVSNCLDSSVTKVRAQCWNTNSPASTKHPNIRVTCLRRRQTPCGHFSYFDNDFGHFHDQIASLRSTLFVIIPNQPRMSEKTNCSGQIKPT